MKNKQRQQRPWWKKKRWWAVGLLCVFLAGLYTIPGFPFGPYTLYGDMTAEQRAAKIPYETLSDETTQPYLAEGQIIRGPRIKAAVERWPDVRSCLVKSERDKTEPDLRLIDWNQFWTNEDAQVCLWRIFTSFGYHESVMLDRVKTWMMFHGKGELSDSKRRSGIKRLLMYWDLEQKGLMFPRRGLESLIGTIFVHGESINTAWDKNGNLYSVSVSKTIK